MDRLLRAVMSVLLLVAGSLFTGTYLAASEVEHEAEHDEKFVLGLFVGGTEAEGSWESTLGLELTYHINHLWSAFALLERSEREKDTTLGMIGAGLHPYKGLVLIAGVGRKDPEDQREAAARLGIAYELELGGGWGLEPYVGVDFIENHEENEHVMGVYIVKKF